MLHNLFDVDLSIFSMATGPVVPFIVSLHPAIYPAVYPSLYPETGLIGSPVLPV